MGCSSERFMWLQAWNCWLMQQRKRKVDDQTSHHTGAPASADTSSTAAMGVAGRTRCRVGVKRVGIEPAG